MTKTLLATALVAGSATLATAAENFDPLINHETAPIITVSQRTLQSAPVRLNERTKQYNDAWMQLNRCVPGNAGATSYGGDWAATLGRCMSSPGPVLTLRRFTRQARRPRASSRKTRHNEPDFKTSRSYSDDQDQDRTRSDADRSD